MRGDIRERTDVNYSASSILVSKRYANPNYVLTPLRRVIHTAQYGISLPATEEPIGIPMIRMNNLQNDGWDLTDLKYIELSEKEIELYRVNSGDILFNRTNSKELVGKCEVFGEEGDWVFASYLIRIVLDQTTAIPEFVSAFLSTKAGRIQIDRVSRQIIGMSNVNAEELQDLLIPLPPIEIQRSLVAEIEAARQSRKQKLAQADELLSRLDGHLLDQLGLNMPEESDKSVFAIRLGQVKTKLDSYSNQPRFRKLIQRLQSHEFPVEQLNSLAIDIFSGTTPKSGGDAYTESLEGIPFIRSGEITKDGRVTEDNAIFIKPEIHDGLMHRSQLQQGDLLIAIVGATIGSVGVYNRPNPANINQAIAAVRLDCKQVLPDFARWFLSSPIGQSILDYLKRPVARANINLEEIGEILILIPPLEIQRSVIEQVDHARQETRRLRQEAETEWEYAKTRFERKLLGEEV